MSTLEQAAREALAALEDACGALSAGWATSVARGPMDRLRVALDVGQAQAVAWVEQKTFDDLTKNHHGALAYQRWLAVAAPDPFSGRVIPLYAAPPAPAFPTLPPQTQIPEDIAAVIFRNLDSLYDASDPTPAVQPPIDMVLHCPACGLQHIDAADPLGEASVYSDGRESRWSNPPHRSHLCHGCGHVWRPADVPTNGVAAVKTKGKNDAAIAKGAE